MTEALVISIRRGGQIIRSFVTDDAEDGVTVEVNGTPVVALDLMYSGLAVGGPGGESAVDPEDPTNIPKLVIGSWPDGEQWERLRTIALPDLI